MLIIIGDSDSDDDTVVVVLIAFLLLKSKEEEEEEEEEQRVFRILLLSVLLRFFFVVKHDDVTKGEDKEGDKVVILKQRKDLSDVNSYYEGKFCFLSTVCVCVFVCCIYYSDSSYSCP